MLFVWQDICRICQPDFCGIAKTNLAGLLIFFPLPTGHLSQCLTKSGAGSYFQFACYLVIKYFPILIPIIIREESLMKVFQIQDDWSMEHLKVAEANRNRGLARCFSI